MEDTLRLVSDQSKQKSEILTFVEGLFESSRIPNISGIIIELDNGNKVKISLLEVDDAVIVYADNIEMGRLKPSESRCYKYNFHQKYRKGMKKNGLTVNEAFIEGVFKSVDIVRFNEA